jgi:hypothetical protein
MHNLEFREIAKRFYNLYSKSLCKSNGKTLELVVLYKLIQVHI